MPGPAASLRCWMSHAPPPPAPLRSLLCRPLWCCRKHLFVLRSWPASGWARRSDCPLWCTVCSRCSGALDCRTPSPHVDLAVRLIFFCRVTAEQERILDQEVVAEVCALKLPGATPERVAMAVQRRNKRADIRVAYELLLDSKKAKHRKEGRCFECARLCDTLFASEKRNRVRIIAQRNTLLGRALCPLLVCSSCGTHANV